MIKRTITGSRRKLDAMEADRLIRSWELEDDERERAEPLHVYLGWTENELLEYQVYDRLPG